MQLDHTNFKQSFDLIVYLRLDHALLHVYPDPESRKRILSSGEQDYWTKRKF